MKSIALVALALVAVAAALPVEETPVVLRSDIIQQPDGSYQTVFETSNGIKQQERGTLKEVLDEDKKPHTVVVVEGEVAYTRNDGSVENIKYYADETGYHADGPSVPKPL